MMLSDSWTALCRIRTRSASVSGSAPVWVSACLGQHLSGSAPVRVSTSLSQYLSGSAPVWVSTCLVQYLSGSAPVWVSTCLGHYLSGSVPVWVTPETLKHWSELQTGHSADKFIWNKLSVYAGDSHDYMTTQQRWLPRRLKQRCLVEQNVIYKRFSCSLV